MSVQTPVHVLGGMAEHTVLLARLLVRLGHHVTLLTTRHPAGREAETSDGVEIRYLAGTRPDSQRGGWWPASVRAFDECHRAKPFDVVLSQSTGAAGLVWQRAANARPPVVVFCHGTSPQMMTSIWHALLRSPRWFRALPYSVRRLASNAVGFWRIDRPLYAAAAAVIVVTDVVAASVRHWFPAVKRLRQVPYAIDVETFRADPGRRRAVRTALGLDQDQPLLVGVGMLSAQKGFHVAIDALVLARGRVPDVRLVIVGDGEEADNLRRHADRHGVGEAVTFVGRVARDVTADFYNAADVFIMPTLRVESFGLVLGEAMACETPVVASRIGATPEVVADGVTGILVPPGEAAALAEAAVGLLTDASRARAMGRAGRARVCALWDAVHHARAVEAVLAEVEARTA